MAYSTLKCIWVHYSVTSIKNTWIDVLYLCYIYGNACALDHSVPEWSDFIQCWRSDSWTLFLYFCFSPALVIEQNLYESRLFAYTLLQTWRMGACGEDVIILYSVVDNVVSALSFPVLCSHVSVILTYLLFHISAISSVLHHDWRCSSEEINQQYHWRNCNEYPSTHATILCIWRSSIPCEAIRVSVEKCSYFAQKLTKFMSRPSQIWAKLQLIPCLSNFQGCLPGHLPAPGL